MHLLAQSTCYGAGPQERLPLNTVTRTARD